jgi:GNAT superfamily N-acetyltransferase
VSGQGREHRSEERARSGAARGSEPSPTTVRAVRPARPDDVPTVLGLVRELAAYEKAAHEVVMTEAQLHEALFGSSPSVSAHVAEDGDGEVAGFALWFLTFSTWRGTSGIHLEDLYVSPGHRGTGLGRELEWSVLDWNTPSIDFYRAAGAVPMDEWTTFRLTDEALTRFAADRR